MRIHDIMEHDASLFVRDVAKVDCATFDPMLGIIGQSWHVDVMLTGPTDVNGFVYDFSPLKKLIKQVLQQSFDHALIIPVGSQHVQYCESSDAEEEWVFTSRARNGVETRWNYLCPKGAVLPIRSVHLSKSILEAECTRLLKHRLPVALSSLSVKLREENIGPTEASYRYTHGITGHDGLCQRLFHGHRSRIEIYVADERRADLEQFIARELFASAIHIATLDQVTQSGCDLPIGKKIQSTQPVTLSYQGSLGAYQAIIPANRLFFVERTTSVECISQEIHRFLKSEEQISERLKVICFEGIDKGSIADEVNA